MIDELQGRLAQLHQEYRAGEVRLHDLVRQETALRETLLRISGAIQVLQEVLDSVPILCSDLSSGSAPGSLHEERVHEERVVNGAAAGGPRVLTVP